jgi:ParB-like chromosome segregation protein Spo0J
MIQNVPINTVKANPNNPRIIKDDKFAKLVKSINEFPQMLNLRPIVVNDDMVVLGGNMRLKACKEAGLKEIPIIKASELTEQQQKEFIVKDNVGYGEWDWNDLANNWDADQLQDWGLDIPGFMELPSEDELTEESKNKPPTIKITFETVEDLQQAEIDIVELIDRKYPKAFFSVSAGEL